MPIKIKVEHPERCMGCLSCVFTCSLELFGEISVKHTAIRVLNLGVGNNYKILVCSICDEPDCAAACPYDALKAKTEGGVELVRPDKCKECKDKPCLDACSIGALFWDDEAKKPIICTNCGECAKICPHEVISYGEIME